MKGSVSLGVIIAVVVGFSAAAVVIVSYVEGPLADVIEEGRTQMEMRTDHTIDVEKKQDLSDLSMLVYHRASNDGCKYSVDDSGQMTCGSEQHPTICHQINGKYETDDSVPDDVYWDYGEEGGYPGLAGSYLGRFPRCASTGSTGLVGNGAGATQQTGYDMEGIFSRESFRITDEAGPITLRANSPREEAESYLDYKLAGFSKRSFEYWTSCQTEYRPGTKRIGLFFDVDKDLSGRVGNPMGNEEGNPAGSDWIQSLGRYQWGESSQYDFEAKGGPYCSPSSWPETGNGEPREITLCPGDKGYIQMNKGSPTNEGEAAESQGNAPNYAYIQITSVEQESCKDLSPSQPGGQTHSPYMGMKVNYNKYPGSMKKIGLAQYKSKNNGFNPSAFPDPTPNQCVLRFKDVDGLGGDDKTGKDDEGQVIFWNGTLVEQNSGFPSLSSSNVAWYNFRSNFDTGVTSEMGSGDLYRDKIAEIGFSGESVETKEFDFLTGQLSQGGQRFMPYGDLICGNYLGDSDTRSEWAVCDESLPQPRVKVHESGNEIVYSCHASKGNWVRE